MGAADETGSAGGSTCQLDGDVGCGNADVAGGEGVDQPAQRLALQIGRARGRGGEFAADDEGGLQPIDDPLHLERVDEFGWMLVPPDLARSVECLAQNFYISPPALSQLAALAVFGCRTELDDHVRRYRQNRDLLIRALAGAGLTRLAPAEGAFYLYIDISSLTRDSADFCRRLLAEAGVGTDATS
jgi:hypothetical protein